MKSSNKLLYFILFGVSLGLVCGWFLNCYELSSLDGRVVSKCAENDGDSTYHFFSDCGVAGLGDVTKMGKRGSLLAIT